MASKYQRKQFSKYIQEKYHMSEYIYNKIFDSLNDTCKSIVLDYYDNHITNKEIAKKYNLNNADMVTKLIAKIEYIYKLYTIRASGEELELYHSIMKITPDSYVTVLKLNTRCTNALIKYGLYKVQDVIDFYNEGHRLTEILYISRTTEKLVLKKISIFLPLETVVEIKYPKTAPAIFKLTTKVS